MTFWIENAITSSFCLVRLLCETLSYSVSARCTVILGWKETPSFQGILSQESDGQSDKNSALATTARLGHANYRWTCPLCSCDLTPHTWQWRTGPQGRWSWEEDYHEWRAQTLRRKKRGGARHRGPAWCIATGVWEVKAAGEGEQELALGLQQMRIALLELFDFPYAWDHCVAHKLFHSVRMNSHLQLLTFSKYYCIKRKNVLFIICCMLEL